MATGWPPAGSSSATVTARPRRGLTPNVVKYVPETSWTLMGSSVVRYK
jgi:hypothetical protein